MLTIIRGKQFLLCDERGDIADDSLGLFAHDTRHLSRWVLRVDGQRPQALGESHGQHIARSFVQRNVASANLEADAVLVRRHLVLAPEALHARMELRNIGMEPLDFPIDLELGADFDDIFTVKDATFALTGDDPGEVGLGEGARHHAEHGPTGDGHYARNVGEGGVVCHIHATSPFDVVDGSLRWIVDVAPKETWQCDLRVAWDSHVASVPIAPDRFDAEFHAAQHAIEAWRAGMPTLSGALPSLAQAWTTSIDDLGALRIGSVASGGEHMLTAAGAPWFMTVFGRDSLITCMQTLLLGPHRARFVLEYLADRQALEDDPGRDAEPGKILHEVREAAIAVRGYDRYYGSVDSTPLFLMLLGEFHSWTGDDDLVRRLWPSALRAIEWIEVHGDLSGDGWVRYDRRAERGLENQSWKDSWDSQRHEDGSLGRGAIAPVEVQAYAYAARRALARLARDVMHQPDFADRLDAAATDLRARIRSAFWVTPNGNSHPGDAGFYALGLDGDERPMATLTSNVGHLLWCGVVDADHAAITSAQLVGPSLFSGWGIRTMADRERAYNPISYHCGTVWPHDTALAVAGLMAAGHTQDAATVARGLLDAAERFNGRLPEVFAGLTRETNPWPVQYPTASSPQAWAAGAPIHMVAALLGIRPDPVTRQLVSSVTDVPDWLGGLEIANVQVFERRWRISVSDGAVSIVEE
ncbi:MAG: Amylo-alpha6-glucosidase [Thermoleophilia bacterium]|nr:Amylo-alpha6-glucosidase [Thermoleophilia bacterium]